MDLEKIRVHGLPPADVQRARELISGTRDTIRCGRPTKADALCTQRRDRLMPSCPFHVTPHEVAAAEVERVRLTAIVDTWNASLTPACHSWPVTADDRRAVVDLPKLPGNELDEASAAHGLLHDWQQGRCAVCGGRGGRSEDLVLDHDHTTALVRGWLCRSCNVAEPRSDRGDFVKYRDRPPAVLLGVAARYWDPFRGFAEPDRSELSHNQHPSFALMADLPTTDPAPR